MKAIAAKRKTRASRSVGKKGTQSGSQWPTRIVDRLGIVEAPALARLPWLTHGFSTRIGGVSTLPGHEGAANRELALNLGFTEWDTREAVLENRNRFFRTIGTAAMPVVALRQIHSDIVRAVDGRDFDSKGDAAKADALVTSTKGVVLAIQTADCIPILLADTKRKAVAAIHAGWRGTLQRIAEKTIGRMQMEFGTQPTDIVAVLGPGIGGCCYEVGHEVASEFAAQFPNAREWFEGTFDAVASGDNDPNWLPWLTMKPPGHAPAPPRVHFDLIAANRWILMNAGVQAKNISASGFCTSCRTDLFFSYRRERSTGRMIAAIAIV
jgi:polyphenol oxidase